MLAGGYIHLAFLVDSISKNDLAASGGVPVCTISAFFLKKQDTGTSAQHKVKTEEAKKHIYFPTPVRN